MTSIEEILWNYIDGFCTPGEQKIITALIAEEEVYRLKYQELLNLNKHFSAMELEEPSMAFSYNVMEAIRTENARVPLKAAINKKVILGIVIFFTVTLLALLVFIFLNVKFSGQNAPVNLTMNFKMPAINFSKARAVVEGFVFFDVILALYLLDAYLRKKNTVKQV